MADWIELPFSLIDIQSISDACTAMSKTVLLCERNMPGSSALQYLKKIVWDFKETMPVVEALYNPLLQDIHYAEIASITGQENFDFKGKMYRLGELINLGVAKY